MYIFHSDVLSSIHGRLKGCLPFTTESFFLLFALPAGPASTNTAQNQEAINGADKSSPGSCLVKTRACWPKQCVAADGKGGLGGGERGYVPGRQEGGGGGPQTHTLTNMGFLDHAHIVGAVTNAQGDVPCGLHQGRHQSLLLGGHPTADHCRTLLPHLHTHPATLTCSITGSVTRTHSITPSLLDARTHSHSLFHRWLACSRAHSLTPSLIQHCRCFVIPMSTFTART